MPKRFGFGTSEKLKSKKEIDALFATGKSVSAFPLRAVYRFTPDEAASVKAGVSASKKSFKKAVHRNRLKRLLREAYRLQKEELLADARAAQKSGQVFFLYTGKELSDFETVRAAMASCLQKLRKQL